MILEAYNQRLLAQITDGNPGGSSVYVSWAVIDGNTAQVIGTENKMFAVPSDGGTYSVLDYADGATVPTDPRRMRKVLTIQMSNNGTATARRIHFLLERGGDGWTGVYQITPRFLVPAGGMLFYSPETGWVVYDADGKAGNVGPEGPAGATGVLDDGSYSDIAVSSAGTVMTVAASAIGTAKLGGDITAAGKALLDDADAAAQRTTLGLGTAATTASTAYEASGGIATHAALTTTHGISAFGATLVDDADASTARTTLGLGTAATTAATAYEASGAIATHAALTTTHGISAFGATLVDDANASAARTTLGLGTAATTASTDYATASHTHTATAISDSTAVGRTLLTAADAAAQRTALGLGTAATTAATAYAKVQTAFLTGTQANSTVTPAVLTGHTFTLTPGQSMTLNAVLVCSSAAVTTGVALGLRVAQAATADRNAIGSVFQTVMLTSTLAASGLHDGDVFNVAANANGFVEILGTATTATNNAAALQAVVKNTSTNVNTTVTVEFRSEVATSAVTAQIGTGAVAVIG